MNILLFVIDTLQADHLDGMATVLRFASWVFMVA